MFSETPTYNQGLCAQPESTSQSKAEASIIKGRCEVGDGGKMFVPLKTYYPLTGKQKRIWKRKIRTDYMCTFSCKESFLNVKNRSEGYDSKEPDVVTNRNVTYLEDPMDS